MTQPRCAALDKDGRQCRRAGLYRERFGGDPEMRGWPHENHPQWVQVMLCDKHWEGPWRKKSGRTVVP